MDVCAPFDQADAIREDLLKELHFAEARSQTVDVLFERLVGSLRQVGELGKKLKAANEKGSAEASELTAELEKARARLVAIVKQFPAGYLPPGKKNTNDPVALARTVEVGTWNAQQRLTAIENELEEANKKLEEAKKEAEVERGRLERLQKLVKEAELLLKNILGSTKAEALNEMIEELRTLIDNERRGNAAAKKKLEWCLKVQKDLKAEFDDVRKILRQLYKKCAQIEQAMNELCVKGVGQAPTYQEDADEAELFDQAIKWLMEMIRQLMAAIRDSNARLNDNEQQQKKLDEAGQDSNANKRADAAIGELTNKIQNADALVKAENAAADAAEQAADDRRKLYEDQLDQLKGIGEDEKARAEKMADIMKPAGEDLTKPLDQLKEECKQANEKNENLARLIDKVLNELKNLQDRRNNYNQAEEERSKALDREEDGLRDRLRDAEKKLKEAGEKRRAAMDELRDLKKELNDLAEDQQGLGERFNPEKDDLLKTQADIIRTQNEIDRLKEKAAAGDRTSEARQLMLKDMQEHHDDLAKKVRQLEKENERLRWEVESGDESGACTKCEDLPDATREEQLLRSHNDNLQREIDDLRRRLDKARNDLGPNRDRPRNDQGPSRAPCDDADGVRRPDRGRDGMDTGRPRDDLGTNKDRPRDGMGTKNVPCEDVEGPSTHPSTDVSSMGQGTGESENGGDVDVKLNINLNLEGDDEENGSTM